LIFVSGLYFFFVSSFVSLVFSFLLSFSIVFLVSQFLHTFPSSVFVTNSSTRWFCSLSSWTIFYRCFTFFHLLFILFLIRFLLIRTLANFDHFYNSLFSFVCNFMFPVSRIILNCICVFILHLFTFSTFIFLSVLIYFLHIHLSSKQRPVSFLMLRKVLNFLRCVYIFRFFFK
jgi:hypothetical protein